MSINFGSKNSTENSRSFDFQNMFTNRSAANGSWTMHLSNHGGRGHSGSVAGRGHHGHRHGRGSAPEKVGSDQAGGRNTDAATHANPFSGTSSNQSLGYQLWSMLSGLTGNDANANIDIEVTFGGNDSADTSASNETGDTAAAGTTASDANPVASAGCSASEITETPTETSTSTSSTDPTTETVTEALLALATPAPEAEAPAVDTVVSEATAPVTEEAVAPAEPQTIAAATDDAVTETAEATTSETETTASQTCDGSDETGATTPSIPVVALPQTPDPVPEDEPVAAPVAEDATPPATEVVADAPVPAESATPATEEACDNTPPPPPEPECPVDGTGTVWGDPHFVGAHGEKYDVQGQAGHYYNLLSDKNLQVNAKFDTYAGDMNMISEMGFTAGMDQVVIAKDGQLSVNGESFKDDGSYANGLVTKKGNAITVKTAEYTVDVTAGSYLDANFKGTNVNKDGVMPDGIWGTTLDGKATALTSGGMFGTEGGSMQGGGVLARLDGTRTEASDTTTFKDYEAASLLDLMFPHHNKFAA